MDGLSTKIDKHCQISFYKDGVPLFHSEGAGKVNACDGKQRALSDSCSRQLSHQLGLIPACYPVAGHCGIRTGQVVCLHVPANL